MSINDSYDIESEPIISLKYFYGEPKHIVDKCLIIFSKKFHTYLLDKFECEQIGELEVCNGNIPIYSLTYKNEKIAFYLTGIGSAVASSLCYETHWIIGATKFIMFGSCGSLDMVQTKGKYIIPTESYRGKGCSYYYAPLSDYIDIKNSNNLASIFEQIKVPYVKGRIWTTDSVLRETKALVAKRKKEGCTCQ